MPIDGDRTVWSLLDDTGQFNQRSPTVSPDGRWFAYVSTQSGRDEVYVRPFPGPGGRVPISTEGGHAPVWGRDETELFFRNGDDMLRAELINDGQGLRVVDTTILFSEPLYFRMYNWARPMYDYDRSGDRFLMSRTPVSRSEINVILNWFEELKRLVPGDGSR